MNNIKIGIFCEHFSLEKAKELQAFFSSHNLNPEIKSRELFPTATPMENFLLRVSNSFDLTLILIANNHPGYIWMSKGLQLQHLMGNCKNVYPVFYTALDIPDWWNDKEETVITMDNLDRVINLSRTPD